MRQNRDRDGWTRLRGLRIAAQLTTVGLTLALSVAVGVGLGLLLDRWFGTNWLVIVFTLFGVIAGFQQLLRTVIQSGREQDQLEQQETPHRREEREPSDSEERERGS